MPSKGLPGHTARQAVVRAVLEAAHGKSGPGKMPQRPSRRKDAGGLGPPEENGNREGEFPGGTRSWTAGMRSTARTMGLHGP